MKRFLPLLLLAALPAFSAPTPVDLSAIANVWAIATEGKVVTHGGLDGSNYAYSAAQLSGTVTVAGTVFKLGAADVADALSNLTLMLPTGNFMQLQVLATAAGSSQAAQSWVVTYTDGTTTSITQGVSDWWAPQKYSGESIGATLTRAVVPTGAALTGNFSLYAYSFALDSGKTVKSLTLPPTRNVILLAADLVPTVATPSPPPVGSSPNILSWAPMISNTDGSALTDQAGWKVYIGTASGQYAAPVSLPVGTLTYTFPSISPGTYYAMVTAVSTSEGESARSAEVSITVPPPPAILVLRCTSAPAIVTGMQVSAAMTCSYGP